MGERLSWRFLNAAARGTSHERNGTPCQDDCFVDVLTNDVLLAIASDGAGSASRAEEGSGLVCETLPHVVEKWLREGGRIDSLDCLTVETWIDDIRTAIAARAAQTELTLRDFACTLVVAIVDAHGAAFFQIGDGAIVTGCRDALDVRFWPDSGEYANMTFFITDDDWRQHLHFATSSDAFHDLALMTDGLQRLALRIESRSPHAPFFEPMFRALENAPCGFASGFEPALAAFLGSEAVNARTDDDKSLVLATRRPGASDGSV
jgi:hypothetical protein